MLSLPAQARVSLCTTAVDLRKSFDGLCGLVESVFQGNVLDGHLFLFLNKRRDRIKALGGNTGTSMIARNGSGGSDNVNGRNNDACPPSRPARVLRSTAGGQSAVRLAMDGSGLSATSAREGHPATFALAYASGYDGHDDRGRPHQSLGYCTPWDVYRGVKVVPGPLART